MALPLANLPTAPAASTSGRRHTQRHAHRSAIEVGARGRQSGTLRQASCTRRRAQPKKVRAAANGEDGTNEPQQQQQLAVIPAKPKSAVGELLAYYYREAPHLLRSAIEDQFSVLVAEKEEAEAAAAEQPEPTEASELVLYRRMAEVRAAERAARVEDLMYVSVLEKFAELGVDMLPRIDDYVHTENLSSLKVLMEGVHSKDAVELVKEHVLGVLGPASMAYANTMIKMSKLQAAQVYAASLMFGYFLRRVDSRFQLEASLGTLPESPEEAVERLNRLFSQAASLEESDDPDTAELLQPPSPDAAPQQKASAAGDDQREGLVKRPKNPLRAYVESFDQQTLVETARVVSAEGAAVVEAQTSALFGDIKGLQRQMQQAVGGDAQSMDEVMQRIQDAVAAGSVESVTMTVGTQRRAVLEAVAFGAFLRDVETRVEGEYQLLTPTPPPSVEGGPGLLGA